MKIVKLYSLSVVFFPLAVALIAPAQAATPSPGAKKAPATGAPAAKGNSQTAAKAARKAKPIFAVSDSDAIPHWIVTDYKSDTPGNVFYNNERR